jgi:Domain of unknown function (DUF3883)
VENLPARVQITRFGGPDVTGTSDLRASEILGVTRRRIEIFADAGDAWRFAASIKSVSEDAAQEYEGRAVLELIQNGHDAIGSASPGRINVLLDLAADAALYVANDGEPFSWANFKALIEVGLSDKGPGEGIGNKGLGFRSVLGLSDHPEVYSRDPDDPADSRLSGYSFRFPAAAEMAALTDDEDLGRRLADEVSPLNLPVPASAEDPEVLKFASDGFATVIKLPLRDDRAVADARRQIEVLANAEAPVLLFLTRIMSLEFTVRTDTGEADSTVLTRSEVPTSLLGSGSEVKEVDLGPQGRYVLARRQTSPEALRDAIRRSVEARQVDARWLDWDGEAWVAVAVPLGVPGGAGTIYTFLPTQQPSPSAAHVHAPFFAKLARREVNVDVALNDYLMGEIAAVSLSLLRLLRDAGEHEAAAPLVVDLAAWSPGLHRFLSRACEQAGTSLRNERLVPLAGGAEWSSLEEAYAWPTRLSGLSVVTPEALVAIGCPVLDPGIGQDRQQRLVDLHGAVIEAGMEPSAGTLAGWSESLAAAMQSAGGTDLDSWAGFYDDLAAAFQWTAAELRGRKIILDQESRLQPAMGAEPEDRRARQLFFAPSADDEEGDTVAVKLPRPLAARVAFTHPGIPWNLPGPVRRRRPGRTFLEDKGLVREYRTDQLLAVLRDLLAGRPSDRVRAAALQFAFSIYPSLNAAQQAGLASIPFAVPTISGDWRRATACGFSRSWETEGGQLLDRLLAAATESTPGLQLLRQQVIIGPADWPVSVRDRARWERFLRSIGVHDGLPVTRTAVQGGQGTYLWPQYLSPGLGLSTSVAEAWAQDVAEHWDGGLHRYTRYQFSAPIATLPGAGEIEALDDAARETYAPLLARGLATWPPAVFEVRVSRPERRQDQQDAHTWPTPASAYLRHGEWLPVDNPDDDGEWSFVRPGDAWLSVAGQLPRFVPQIKLPVRAIVTGEAALRRLRTLGVRVWDEPAYCGQVLRQLPELLYSGRVAAHDVASFKKQCRQAWVHLIEDHARWPWQSGEVPTFVVTEQARLRALKLEPGITVFVPDEADEVKQALFGMTTQPVLVVDPDRGQDVAALLRSQGYEAVRTSEVPVAVFADDQLVIADPGLPSLIAEGRQWVSTVVALVADLKAGPFMRHTEQSIRRLLDRLRNIRFARPQSVRIMFGQDEIEPPEQMTSLPIDDQDAPTVVTWGSYGSVYEEMETCADAIAVLIGQPQLAAEMQLAFTRLGRLHPGGPPAEFDDQALAAALQVSEGQIREARDSLRGPLLDVLERARVLLAYFGDTRAVASFDTLAQGATQEEAITAALAAFEDLLPMKPGDLVAACREHPGFAALRDALDLDFARYNHALASVDPPHPQLRHPERHARAMAQFTETHRQAILYRLREAYLPVALRAGDLTDYGKARNLEGVDPDPAWLDLYAEPPVEIVAGQVGRWLAAHGADTDLAHQSSLADVSELRSRNFTALDAIARDADFRVRAWARKHGTDVPAGWNAPATSARSALEQSYLADFFELAADQILGVMADALGWPDQMSRTLDLDELGLVSADLLSREEEAAGERQQRHHERTHLHIDGREVSVETANLRALADEITAGLDEGLLAQSGKATLAAMPSRRTPRPRSEGGDGLTVARLPGMSEEQKTAVGLVGEVVARAWLERHYSSVEWVSGYRNIVLGGNAGSDSHGYDFIASRTVGRRLYFEVKAFTDDVLETVEFELGETEVVAAQQHRDAYRIVLVSAALDSSSRRILELPNPLGARGSGRYTLLGRGLRYRCSFGMPLG